MIGKTHYLFINGRFPQYSQTFVHDQIRALKQTEDAEVTVFARSRAAFRFENSVPECASELAYAKPLNVRLLRRVLGRLWLAPVRSFRLLSLAVRNKISWQTFLLVAQIKRDPDITVTHFGNNYKVGVELKTHVFPRMKNIVVFHGHDVSSYVEKNGWTNYEAASEYIDGAICVNKVWARELSLRKVSRKVETIYLGTDVEQNRERRRNGDFNVYSILFVGRFVEKKGFDILFSSVKSILSSGDMNIRVHCVGDGPELGIYKDRANKDGLIQNFVFYGASQNSFVKKLMAECDVFVAPSRVASDGDSEGLPVVIMEAMSAGIPVISTFHSGIPELVGSGERGLLIPEGDVGALEGAIRYSIARPDRMMSMAAAAREHVEQFHDQRRQVQAFLNALRTM